jgi:hypothetical protein
MSAMSKGKQDLDPGPNKKKRGKKQESVLRAATRDALKPLHVIAIENGEAHPGTPDQNYDGRVRWDPKTGEWENHRSLYRVTGMLELKRARLPESPYSQQVKVEVRKEQRVFWAERHQAGGVVHVLLEIDHPSGRGRGLNLWFEAPEAVEHVGISRLPALAMNCVSCWFPGSRGVMADNVRPWPLDVIAIVHRANRPVYGDDRSFEEWIRTMVAR